MQSRCRRSDTLRRRAAVNDRSAALTGRRVSETRRAAAAKCTNCASSTDGRSWRLPIKNGRQRGGPAWSPESRCATPFDRRRRRRHIGVLVKGHYTAGGAERKEDPRRVVLCGLCVCV